MYIKHCFKFNALNSYCYFFQIETTYNNLAPILKSNLGKHLGYVEWNMSIKSIEKKV